MVEVAIHMMKDGRGSWWRLVSGVWALSLSIACLKSHKRPRLEFSNVNTLCAPPTAMSPLEFNEHLGDDICIYFLYIVLKLYFYIMVYIYIYIS